MKREVVVRPVADRDIDQVADYFAKVSPAATERFYQALSDAFKTLETLADIGQRYDFADGSESGLRFMKLKSFSDYLLFYRIVGDTV